MTDKNRRTVLLAVFPALAGLLLNACSSEDPAAQIKRQIAAMQTAIEKREPGGFLKYVSDDFQGQSGQLDRQSLRGMLASQLMAHNRVAVTLGTPEVKLHGADRATVKISAFVVGGQWLPEQGRTLEIESGWQKDGTEWKCYTATWK